MKFSKLRSMINFVSLPSRFLEAGGTVLQPSPSSLIGAMKEVNGNSDADSSERKPGNLELDKGAPFDPIPNVSRFEIVVSKLDELFLKLGIRKRLDKAKIKYTPYKNKDVNRFVAHQLIRLSKLDDRQYGSLILPIMRRSRVFYMLGVTHVTKRKGHRTMPGFIFMKLRKGYLNIMDRNEKELDFARVYLEKPNGGGRPLGVPRLKGRIFLHLLNQFIVYRLHERLKDNQHGFRPNHGTLTAGIEILEKVISQPFIYEYDFKGYFDNLNQKFLNQILSDMGIEGKLYDLITTLNRSVPKLPKDQKLPEPDASIVMNPQGTGIVDNGLAAFKPRESREEYIKKSCYTMMGKYIPELDNEYYKAYAGTIWDKTYGSPNPYSSGQKPLIKTKGLPQGSPMSPFLSNLVLDRSLLSKGPKIVQYADDGIMYFNGADISDYISEGKVSRKGRPKHTPDSLKKREGTYKEISNQVSQALFKTRKLINEGNLETGKAAQGTLERIQESIILREAGIIWEPKKSGGVKFNGEWIKPLKFLGLEYDGNTNTLRAHTRKGSRLIYDKGSLLEAREKGFLQSKTGGSAIESKKSSGHSFVTSKYAGGVLSRLYNGSGNQEDYFQNFNMTMARGTWAYHYSKWYKTQEKMLEFIQKISIEEYIKTPRKERVNIAPVLKTQVSDYMLMLTVQNSTSIAFRSALEAIRVQEGKSPREPQVADDPAMDPKLPGEHGGGDLKSVQRRSILNGQRAVAGGLSTYREFILQHIKKTSTYSKFSPEQSWNFYMAQYPERKIKHIEQVLKSGERLITDARLTLGKKA